MYTKVLRLLNEAVRVPVDGFDVEGSEKLLNNGFSQFPSCYQKMIRPEYNCELSFIVRLENQDFIAEFMDQRGAEVTIVTDNLDNILNPELPNIVWRWIYGGYNDSEFKIYSFENMLHSITNSNKIKIVQPKY